jgi:A/G-specific adenine glycosylase
MGEREPRPEPSPREPKPVARARAIAAGVRRSLGAWYDGARRELPWRSTRDPWAILLSEVMAQQTRVETVVPYYHRMTARFPTPAAMAEASLDEVLELWSGLGYYRRARGLWLAAREISARFGGAVPDRAEDLRELPGIGAYTAGAVASIAFDRPEAVVDGNVARVLSRLLAIELDLGSAEGRRALWSSAGALVPRDRPGRFNEALMELGARVCTPRSPGCAACPIAAPCAARARSLQGELPRKRARREPPRVALVAAVLLDPRGRPVLCKRPAKGLFGGLWEPPMLEGDVSGVAARLRGAGLLGRGERLAERGSVVHVLSHRELVVAVARGRAPRTLGAPPPPYVDVAFADGSARGLSTLARRVLAVASPGEPS